MKVTKIVLNGFKSFPEKTEIILSDNITLVVGPNGCGKTNIFEALRFAMGESKLSKLRVKELRELIFAGTKEKRALPFAEVSIEINSGEVSKIFTRRVYRDNSQEFYINQEKVSEKRYRDEIERIFGKKSYSHFQWEDVEELIRKPKERIKEMIFEACELYDFDHKKKVMQRRLERAEKELKAFEIVIKDKEQRLKQLEEERKRAERYRNLSNMLKEKRILLRRAEYTKLLRDISRREEDLKSSEGFLKTLEDELIKIKRELEKKESKKKELENKIQEIKVKKTPLLNKREEALSILNKKYGEYTAKSERLNKLDFLINERKREVEKLEKELEESYVNEEELKNLEIVEKEFREYEKKEGKINKELTILNVKFEEFKRGIKNKKARLNELIKEIEEVKNKIERHKGEIENLKTQEKIKEQEVLNLDEKIKEFQEKIEKLEKEKRKISNNIHTLEGEYLRLSSANSTSLNMLKNYPSLSSFINFEKKDEFLFILDDVLEAKIYLSENLSKELIEYLEKGGKIIIERDNEEVEGVEIFKNLNGLKTFIKERFVKVKKFKNLEEALKEWKEKNCDICVTQDGYIITKEGIIRKILKEKIERTRRLNEIENTLPQLRKKLDEIEIELKSQNKLLSDIRIKRENILKELRDIVFKKNSLVSELDIENRKIERLKEEKENLEKEIEKTHKEVEEIESRIIEKEKEMSILKEKKEKISYDIIRAKELREKQAKYKSLKDKFEFLKKSLFEVQIEKEELSQKVEELKKEIEKLEREREELDKELEVFQKEEEEISSNYEKINEEINNYKEIYYTKEAQIDKLREKIIKLANELKQLRGELTFFKEDIEVIEEKVSIKKLREEIEYIEKEIESMYDVNLAADQEFKELERDYYKKIEAFKDLEESIKNLRESIRIMEEKAVDKYTDFLENIKEELNNVSKVLLGGDIKLKIEDPRNILESPISIDVSPSGKKVRSVLLLSGGERSLFALSVLFALANLSPSPLFALDEVDAALDDSNTLRFRSYIEKIAEKSQILLITHNKRTMEVASRVFGITMENGISRVYGIEFEKV